MLLVVGLAILLGVGFLALSPALVLLARGGSRERQWLELAPRRTCAQLLGLRPRRCVVVGELGPGPSGLQVAPVSGAAVAWHRTLVWRRSRSPGTGEARDELVWEHASHGPITLRDATGSVLVDPALFDPGTVPGEALDRGATQRVIDLFQPSDRPAGRGGGPALRELAQRGLLPAVALERADDRDTKGYRVQELVVRADRPVSVLAAPALRDGRLVLERPRRGRFLVASRAPQALAASARDDAVKGYGCAAAFALLGAFLLWAAWLVFVLFGSLGVA